jgi:hypothetical protein
MTDEGCSQRKGSVDRREELKEESPRVGPSKYLSQRTRRERELPSLWHMTWQESARFGSAWSAAWVPVYRRQTGLLRLHRYVLNGNATFALQLGILFHHLLYDIDMAEVAGAKAAQTM